MEKLSYSSTTPRLRRLLNRQQVHQLLQAYQAGDTDIEIAVIGVDGEVFVTTSEQFAPNLLEIDGTGLTVQSLDVRGQQIAWLVASEESAAVNALALSLVLLLEQVLEKRDMGQETLEGYRELNLLYEVSETIGACIDPNEIPPLIVATAGRLIDFDLSLVLIGRTLDTLEIQYCDGDSALCQTVYENFREIINTVFTTGRPLIESDHQVDAYSVLCAPLKAVSSVQGVFLAVQTTPMPMFTAGDEKLTMVLASQAGIALEKARLYKGELQRQLLEEEMNIGKRIQLSLLPESCPTIDGWDFAAYYQAARQVGGDLYDYFDVPGEGHQLGMVIADITGKGIPAALFMGVSRAIIRNQALLSVSPAETLKCTNRAIISENRMTVPLSAFYAILDPQTGTINFANGGHDYPFLLRAATKQIDILRTRSFLLGVFDAIDLEEGQTIMQPGDMLVLYTDGIVDAHNHQGQVFDEDRLYAVIQQSAETSAEQLVMSVIDAVHEFSGDTAQTDDLTLFVVKRL